MLGRQKTKRNILGLTAAFAAFGLVHVAADGVDFTDCIMQILYSVLVLIWGVRLAQRIIDRRIYRLLCAIVLFMELYFLFQIFRYRLFAGDEILRRYSWYAYYIPMMIVPLLLFCLSLYMNRQEDEQPDWKWTLLAVPASLLVIGFLTNDLHQLALGAATETSDGSPGILLYLFWGYAACLLLAALYTMLRKCGLPTSKKDISVLSVTLGACALLLLTYTAGYLPRIAGAYVWNIGEIFAFCTMLILESCVYIGLIRTNAGYEQAFTKAMIPGVIRDTQGVCAYRSECAEEDFRPKADQQIQTAEIAGGSVSWMTDMAAVHALNRQIEDVTEQIKARNDYLKTQNSLKEEQSAVDARNQVYDRIAAIVCPQLVQIEALMAEDAGTDFTEQLKKITVYNAYIKRRSNLELLREDSTTLPISEVATAIAESIEYLKLNDAEVLFRSYAEGKVPADAAILAYELFEDMAEMILAKRRMLSVILSAKDSFFSLRMVINTTDLAIHEEWKRDELADCGCRVQVFEDDGDTIVSLLMEKGGDPV